MTGALAAALDGMYGIEGGWIRGQLEEGVDVGFRGGMPHAVWVPTGERRCGGENLHEQGGAAGGRVVQSIVLRHLREGEGVPLVHVGEECLDGGVAGGGEQEEQVEAPPPGAALPVECGLLVAVPGRGSQLPGRVIVGHPFDFFGGRREDTDEQLRRDGLRNLHTTCGCAAPSHGCRGRGLLARPTMAQRIHD